MRLAAALLLCFVPMTRRLERPAEQFRRAGNAAGGAVRRGLLRDTERRLHSPGGRPRTRARPARGPPDVPGGVSPPRPSGAAKANIAVTAGAATPSPHAPSQPPAPDAPPPGDS